MVIGTVLVTGSAGIDTNAFTASLSSVAGCSVNAFLSLAQKEKCCVNMRAAPHTVES